MINSTKRKPTSQKAPSARKDNRGMISRREPLLEAAARLFSSKGYRETSMRDIAAEVDMLVGSIYYHFKSKEELLIAVYREGVRRFTVAMDGALEQSSQDPWNKLERVCVAHLSLLLDGGPFTRIVAPEFFRSFPADIAQEIVHERDAYEKRFAKLISELPLPSHKSQGLIKLSLLGSLNWSLTWYHPGIYTPEDIARQFVSFIRDGLQAD